MINIDTKCILLYLLSKYNEINFEGLKDIENKIFKHDPFMFIDFNQDTICSISEQNPEIFDWSNNVIKKSKNFDIEYASNICDSVNTSLPTQIKDIL